MNKGVIILTLLLLIACSSPPPQTRYERLGVPSPEEFSTFQEALRWKTSVNQDIEALNRILEKQSKSQSIDEYIFYAREYGYAYNIIYTHMNDYYQFLNEHETALQKSQMDTFSEKKWIKDNNIHIQNNMLRMKSTIEDAVAQQRAEEQQVEEVLSLFGRILTMGFV